MRALIYAAAAVPAVSCLSDSSARCYDPDMGEADAPGERYLSILEPGGRLALPQELQERLGWRPGEALVLTLEEGGTVRLVGGSADQVAERSSPDWKRGIQAAAGMWKDRDDLPDWEQLRQESDSDLDCET